METLDHLLLGDVPPVDLLKIHVQGESWRSAWDLGLGGRKYNMVYYIYIMYILYIYIYYIYYVYIYIFQYVTLLYTYITYQII